MATVEPKSQVPSTAGLQGRMFTVDIAMSGFLDTETVNGGRCSPCAADDFATKPTTLAQSLLISRGQLRFKMMLEKLAIRSNFELHNMVTTYSSSAGDNPITDINFTLIYDRPEFVPTTGTTIDGSTSTTTKLLYIQDKIAEALNESRTENMSVYNPTSGAGLISNLAVTVGPVLTDSIGEIVEAITVAESTTFRPKTATQLATDNALTYSAE